jgi:glycosyltransferase involved in cell wall biosynthesis
MKILHVITGMREAAGTSVFVGELSGEQIRSGHIVDIVHQETWRSDIYPLVEGLNLIGKEEFIRTLSCREYDIVHIHGLWEWMLHVFVNICQKKGWPIVWSSHGSVAPWAMNYRRWKKQLAWFLWQKRDLQKAAIFHVTANCEGQWLRSLGFSQDSFIAPLGVRCD